MERWTVKTINKFEGSKIGIWKSKKVQQILRMLFRVLRLFELSHKIKLSALRPISG
jgi:hypothetical protein